MSFLPYQSSRKPLAEIPLKFNPLPGTLHGCLQELKRYDDYQLQIEKHRRIIIKQMQDLLTSQTETQLPDESKAKNVAPPGTPALAQQPADNKTSSVFTFDEINTSEEQFESEVTSIPIKLRNCNFLWDDLKVLSDFSADRDSAPIITVLDKLKWQYKEKRLIKKWCSILTRLFFHCNGTGIIDEGEYVQLVHMLPISIDLKDLLSTKFSRIDHDGSGAINLMEFLHFFLQSRAFRDELKANVERNELLQSTCLPKTLQDIQLYIFNVVNYVSYNKLSMTLFFLDTALTLVPCITLVIEAVCPHDSVLLKKWDEDTYLWVATVFFAVEYIFGLITCEEKGKFVTNVYHVIELISFLPWIIYVGGGYTGSGISPRGFVLFRVLRFFKLAAIFPNHFKGMLENLRLYGESLKLAFVSYKAFGTFIIYMIMYFSLLIYVFERGEYDPVDHVWIRAGENNESPFSNFFDCIYFTVVTGTTLGYGDMYPKTYVGKVISLLTVITGLVNLTFAINIIGDCFEEVFRKFLLNRSAEIDKERSAFIRNNLAEAQATLDLMVKKKEEKNQILKSPSKEKYSTLDAFILKKRKSLFMTSDLRMEA